MSKTIRATATEKPVSEVEILQAKIKNLEAELTRIQEENCLEARQHDEAIEALWMLDSILLPISTAPLHADSVYWFADVPGCYGVSVESALDKLKELLGTDENARNPIKGQND
jgi:hypothetical protein